MVGCICFIRHLHRFISDKMEVYLKDCNKSVEFRQTMENFDLVTEIEFSGATTYKDIEILVNFELKYSL